MRTYFALLLTALMVSPAYGKPKIDSRFVSCPKPVAPDVTELMEIDSVLRFSVAPDGHPIKAKIVSYQGDNKWLDSIQEMAKKCKFKKSKRAYQLDLPLHIHF